MQVPSSVPKLQRTCKVPSLCNSSRSHTAPNNMLRVWMNEHVPNTRTHDANNARGGMTNAYPLSHGSWRAQRLRTIAAWALRKGAIDPMLPPPPPRLSDRNTPESIHKSMIMPRLSLCV